MRLPLMLTRWMLVLQKNKKRDALSCDVHETPLYCKFMLHIMFVYASYYHGSTISLVLQISMSVVVIHVNMVVPVWMKEMATPVTVSQVGKDSIVK